MNILSIQEAAKEISIAYKDAMNLKFMDYFINEFTGQIQYIMKFNEGANHIGMIGDFLYDKKSQIFFSNCALIHQHLAATIYALINDCTFPFTMAEIMESKNYADKYIHNSYGILKTSAVFGSDKIMLSENFIFSLEEFEFFKQFKRDYIYLWEEL